MKSNGKAYVFPEKKTILKEIKDAFLDADIGSERFFRFEFDIRQHDNIDILSWLNAQKNFVKIYFSDRNKNEYAGAGVGLSLIHI